MFFTFSKLENVEPNIKLLFMVFSFFFFLFYNLVPHLFVPSSNDIGRVLLQLFEMCLDNIIFQLGVILTISRISQLVNHRHILFNGYIVYIRMKKNS